VRLGYDTYGHAKHPWKQFSAKRRRKLAKLHFVKTLVPDKLSMSVFLDRPEGIVPGSGKARIVCIGPRPKTLTETPADRSSEGLIRVTIKEVFKEVNIDWCDNSEKRRMVMNCVKCYNISELINRWSRDRRLLKCRKGKSRTWRRVTFGPD
jgi:hypothetical protein